MIHVVTWNVHGFVDATGRFSPEPALRKLGTVDADIVALQEVEDRQWKGRHALNWLAEQGGWHAWAGPTLMRGDSHYGNAVLSRRPALSVRRHDISVSGVEPRGVLEVEFAHAGGRLRLMATHLGLKRAERRRQLERIMEIAGPPRPGRIDVLAGDFNEWLPRWGLFGRLRRGFPAGTRGASFPAHRPMLALDRIWVRPAHAFGGFEILRLARGESDHRPVVAAIR
jgi:endonuclease/exonuclease/phosphatase family metal-dependent hydrolase